jgi:hypothetical protein
MMYRYKEFLYNSDTKEQQRYIFNILDTPKWAPGLLQSEKNEKKYA